MTGGSWPAHVDALTRRPWEQAHGPIIPRRSPPSSRQIEDARLELGDRAAWFAVVAPMVGWCGPLRGFVEARS